MRRLRLFATFATLALLAACASPPPPTPATPKDIAAARELIIGEWACVRAGVGDGRFIYRADGTGEQLSRGLRLATDGNFIEIDVDTTLTWSLMMAGPVPQRLTQNVLSADVRVTAAEVDGANAGASRRFRERFETRLEEKIDGPGGFRILEATGDRLVLEGARGRNDCERRNDA